MKMYTTPEQTAKLIELGFARPRIAAPKLKWVDGEPTFEPQYTIGELLSFLPENIAKENEMPSTLNISLLNGEWCVEYADFLGADFSFHSVEVIDAIFDMVTILKEKGVI